MKWLWCLTFSACTGGSHSVQTSPPPPPPAAPTGDTGETGPTSVLQTFVATPIPQHDILFVVDNSCSMSDNQAVLGTSILPLVDALNAAAVDWHIAITSTDIDISGPCSFGGSEPLNGRLKQVDGVQVIDASTPSPEGVFGAMVMLGTDGSGCEKGIGAAYRAAELLKDTANQDFVRETAGLHIVVVSDEQDQTEDDAVPVVTLIEFNFWLDQLRTTKQYTTFSSVVCLEFGQTCYSLGSRYLNAARNVGGLEHNIELQPYLDPMAELGDIITTRAATHYPLDAMPAVGSVTVHIDGLQTLLFTVRKDVVVLDEPPVMGASIEVAYTAQ